MELLLLITAALLSLHSRMATARPMPSISLFTTAGHHSRPPFDKPFTRANAVECTQSRHNRECLQAYADALNWPDRGRKHPQSSEADGIGMSSVIQHPASSGQEDSMHPSPDSYEVDASAERELMVVIVSDHSGNGNQPGTIQSLPLEESQTTLFANTDIAVDFADAQAVMQRPDYQGAYETTRYTVHELQSRSGNRDGTAPYIVGLMAIAIFLCLVIAARTGRLPGLGRRGAAHRGNVSVPGEELDDGDDELSVLRMEDGRTAAEGDVNGRPVS